MSISGYAGTNSSSFLQLQGRTIRCDCLDDRRGYIEHNAEMQPMVIPITRRRTRPDESAVEFLSVQCIGKRT